MTGTAAAAASADSSTKSMELELPSNRFALEVKIFLLMMPHIIMYYVFAKKIILNIIITSFEYMKL